MIEDKLTPEQRLRLECLVQANINSHGMTPEEIVKKATRFEHYVNG